MGKQIIKALAFWLLDKLQAWLMPDAHAEAQQAKKDIETLKARQNETARQNAMLESERDMLIHRAETAERDYANLTNQIEQTCEKYDAQRKALANASDDDVLRRSL